MRFIDSTILAYAFYENEHQDLCQQALREGGIIDSLNLIEAFNIIEFESSRERAVKSIKSILKLNLIIINVDVNTVFEAMKRSDANKKLRFIDLVHYTIAMLNNCECILSYDSDFYNLDIKRQTP